MFLAKMAENFVVWKFSGDGLTRDKEIKYVKIPVKICPDNLGLYLRSMECRKALLVETVHSIHQSTLIEVQICYMTDVILEFQE